MADKRISQLVERVDIANNDVLPIVASGATTTNKVTISSIQTFMQGNLDLGVTSVGITLGTTGTDVNVSGSPITTSGNITINLPTASPSNRGLLSSADWITFYSKQPAGNYVTLDTAQTITAQKTFTTSGSSDTMIISHGSGSGFALDVIKAGSGEAIRVTKTSGSGNAMTISGGNFEAGTIVKTGGTSTQYLMADGSTSTLTNPVTGTGASGQVAFWNGTSSQTGDNGLFWDNTNKRLGVGTTTPATALEVVGVSRLRGGIEVFNESRIINVNSGGGIRFNTGGSISIQNASNVEFVRFINGNVILQNGGTFTDAGFRLDVNGTARVQGELTVGNGTDSIIRANSSVVSSFQTTFIQASTANTSTMIQIRPSGTNNSMTGFFLTDSSTSAAGTNIMLFGRGVVTLPNTGVTYIGNIVSANPSANSLHLGFLVSNTSLNRFEAARIWNSGNLYLQKGGTFTDVDSAILNVNSTTQGFLPPRMTTTQKNAIASPATGLVVYDNTLNKLSVFTGLVWETVTSL